MTKKQLRGALEIITSALPFNREYCIELGMSDFTMEGQIKWASNTIYKAIVEGVEDAKND